MALPSNTQFAELDCRSRRQCHNNFFGNPSSIEFRQRCAVKPAGRDPHDRDQLRPPDLPVSRSRRRSVGKGPYRRRQQGSALTAPDIVIEARQIVRGLEHFRKRREEGMTLVATSEYDFVLPKPGRIRLHPHRRPARHPLGWRVHAPRHPGRPFGRRARQICAEPTQFGRQRHCLRGRCLGRGSEKRIGLIGGKK